MTQRHLAVFLAGMLTTIVSALVSLWRRRRDFMIQWAAGAARHHIAARLVGFLGSSWALPAAVFSWLGLRMANGGAAMGDVLPGSLPPSSASWRDPPRPRHDG